MVEANNPTATTASSNDSSPSEWPVFGIPDLLAQVMEARDAGKYLFIWDKSDQIDTFFKYKGFLCDFYFTHMKVQNGRATAAEAMEQLRDSFVKAGRQGQPLLINLDEQCPDLAADYCDAQVFATDVAFNFVEWRKTEVHHAVLKEGENYSAAGTNIYFLQPEFSMQIRSTLSNAESVQEVLSKIPNIANFNKIVIQ